MRRFARLALYIAALALLVLLTGAARVDAHALLEWSDPPAYRLLLRPPDRIVLRFTEPVDNRATEIKVLDQDGRRVDRQRFQLSDDRRQATLPVRFPGPGIYTVAWRALSLVDQHTYEGFFTLTVGPLRPGGFTLRGGVPAGPSPWDVAVRWLMLLGAAALVGGTLTHRVVVPAAIGQAPGIGAHVASGTLHNRWRVAAWLGAAAFLAGTAGELIFQAERASQAAGERFGTSLLLLATSEPIRTSLILKTSIPIVILSLLRRRQVTEATSQPAPGVVASASLSHVLAFSELGLVALLPIAITLTGHAAASQATLPFIADWLHLSGASAWVGGLAYLAMVFAPTLTRMDASDKARIVGPFTRRFSSMALGCVAVLIVTGVYAAWVNVPDLNAVTTTSYGRTLAVKIALFVPLLGIAAVNLLVMRPRLVEAAKRLRDAASVAVLQRRFFRLTRLEFLLIVAIAVAAATLALLPTSRQVRALTPTGQPFVLVRRAGGIDARLRIDPYQVGENTFDLRLTDQQGAPVADARVRYTFRPLMENLGTASAEAEPRGDGRFVLSGAYISTRGPWMITVTVRRRGMEDTAFIYPVERDWEGGTPIAPPTDPRAFALLRQADDTMNHLRTLRQVQDLTDGRGGHVVVFSESAAPDAFHYKVIGGLEGLAVGAKRFINEGGGWRVLSDIPFKFPNFTFARNADHVVFGPREVADDRQTQSVVFTLKTAGASARYVVWINEQNHRIIREAMIAPGHYMLSRNYDFDASVKILAPPVR